MSLVSHWRPRRSCVGVPHSCGSVSQSRLHVGQWRSCCSDAPSIESMVAPRNPPIATAIKLPGETTFATTATTQAPASCASVPGSVMPPERPVATGLNVRIERGVCRANVPISVAHVSADAAANAPAKAIAYCGFHIDATAQTVAIPPLAMTCRKSRGPCLPTSTSVRLRARPTRDNTADGIKNTNKTAAYAQPPAAKTAVPTMTAAPAPLAESARKRYAAYDTIAASVKPSNACTYTINGSRTSASSKPSAV